MAHVFDLEERTLRFAREVRDFTQGLTKNIANIEYVKQLIRSSASVGANYIEANESLGNKDFLMKIKICRKEAKESSFWLDLVLINDNETIKHNRDELIQESTELVKIFTTICRHKS